MKSRSRITVSQTQRLSLNTGLATAIRILRADAAGLSRYLEEQAAENPQLVLARQSLGEWLPRWRDALVRSSGRGQDPGGEAPEIEAAGPSLVAHAWAAVAAMRLQDRDARIAGTLIEALEPSGWLGASLAAIAKQSNASVAEVTAVLTQVQQRIDPPGLFAQSLADCLRLQAAEADELDAVVQGVLARLEWVAAGDLGRIARELGVSEQVVRQKIAVIRGFDPKPGTQFQACAAPIREPDLMARKGDAGWEISLNRSALPALSLAEKKGKGRAAAQALIRMVEGRNATLLTVGREILMRQAAALETGVGALEPMTMAEVAEAVGLHQSTISRVVAGAAVDTPKGTWWLRALFSQAISEDGLSAAALRDRLMRLVTQEDGTRPLSDAALAEALSAAGMPVARRTVAKYRGMLGLPPAHRRRKAGARRG
ncbi:RNA polymerase factor sigma-54 [Tabrizicola sp.]|uniref:RNA polymerase factor sigma-54 n=1 Tax=Tabrizicola sp. TaxID=2005166 RepID=UPI00286D4A19|nr:RNA polymerase factor sigma-54 [Tabrizicola sp.]